MKLVKKNEGTVYEAKNHFNNWALRKFGEPDGAKVLNFSISEFQPGGLATMSATPDKERMYYLLRGTMTIHDETGVAYDMEEGDFIYIPAGEKRDMVSTGETSTRLLVILAPVKE